MRFLLIAFTLLLHQTLAFANDLIIDPEPDQNAPIVTEPLEEENLIDNKIYLSDSYMPKNIKINTFYYYCFSHCRKDKEDIKLFDVGISFYRKKMDIIHLFNIILLIEKYASKNESKIPNT
jgi:hypothetical protein